MPTTFEATEHSDAVVVKTACGKEHYEVIDHGERVCVARLLEWYEKHINGKRSCKLCGEQHPNLVNAITLKKWAREDAHVMAAAMRAEAEEAERRSREELAEMFASMFKPARNEKQ